MPNPGVTIETYLAKVKQSDINTVKKQMQDLSKDVGKTSKKQSKANDDVKKSVKELVNDYKTLGREEAMRAVRTKIATNQIGGLREGFRAFGLIIRDAATATGLLNTMLNIMISRFGAMLIVFGLITAFKSWNEALKESTETIDTAIRKVASLVVPTTNLHDATKALTIDMVKFATEVGGSFEQLSDTQFFLASAGLKSAEIHDHFANVQKLVIATAKDLNATLAENKQIVETVMGIYNNFSDTMTQFNTESEKSAHIAAIIFDAYRRNQILLTELAAGMTYSASQARALGVPVEELIYLLAYSNTVMIKGSKAGTSLANAMRDVANKATHMNKVFGIDMSKIGKNFSFLEEVLKPVGERIEETGVTLELFTDLLDGVGARGARAILGLAPHYKDLREQIDGLVDRHEALDDAVKIATESYKNQRQIFKNLKTVINNFWAIAITGGQGYNNILKNANDHLRLSLKFWAGLALIVGFVLGVVMQLGNLIIKIVQWLYHVADGLDHLFKAMYYGIRGNYKGVREELAKTNATVEDQKEVWRSFGRSIKDSFQGLKFLWDITQGAYDEFSEVASEAERKVRGLNEQTGEWAKTSEGVLSISKAYTDTLNEQYNIIENQKNVWEEMSKGFDWFLGSTNLRVSFGREKPEDIMNELSAGLEEFLAGGELVPGFFAKLTEGWKLTEKSFDEYVKHLDKEFAESAKQLNIEYEKAMREAMFEEIDQTPLEVYAEFLLRAKKLAQDYFLATESNRKSFMKKEMEDYKTQGDAIVRDLKNRWKRYAQVAGTDLTLFELGPAGLASLKAENIEFDSDLIPGLRQHIEDKVKALTDVVSAAAEIQLKVDIDEQGLAMTSFGKARRDEFFASFDKGFKEIADEVVRNYNMMEQDAVNQMRDAVMDLIDVSADAEKVLDALTSDSALPEELRLLDKFWKELAGTDKEQIIQTLVNRLKDIRKERDKMVKDFAKLGEADLSTFWGVLGEWLEQTKLEAERTEKALSIKIASIADTLDYAGDAIQNFADIATDDMTSVAQTIAQSMDVVLKSTAQFLDMYMNYKKKLKDIEEISGSDMLKMLSKVSFGFGIFGLVTGIFSQITSIFRDAKREKEKLEEEFLDPESQGRLSPDYGQPRVVNQRISLSPVFQLLDPSQLTEIVQRRIAAMIYEQLKELQKAGAA